MHELRKNWKSCYSLLRDQKIGSGRHWQEHQRLSFLFLLMTRHGWPWCHLRNFQSFHAFRSLLIGYWKINNQMALGAFIIFIHVLSKMLFCPPWPVYLLSSGGMPVKSTSKEVSWTLTSINCLPFCLLVCNLEFDFYITGLCFIGSNFVLAIDEHLISPVGFNIIFPGLVEYAIDMELKLPVKQSDIDAVLYLRNSELERYIYI